MRILVLGGTAFLGRHFVESAARRGHVLTVLHRGRTNPGLFDRTDWPDVETRVGDRRSDLDVLGDERWDAVVDTCGYTPDVVRHSVAALASRSRRYLFVSSLSALTDSTTPGLDESAAVHTPGPEVAGAEVTPQTYGADKVACERVVQAAFGDRALILRPGLLVGPHDPSDRFTYWPRRVAGGGEVLAPPADQPVQLLDARDLAEWMVRLLEAGLGGLYHAAAPKRPLTCGQLLEACRQVTGAAVTFTWVDDAFLTAHEVPVFTGLPLWVPADSHGFLSRDVSRAFGVGLSPRPLAQTIADTLAWDRTRPDDAPIQAGLPLEIEADLLAAWHAARG